jgi:hypothetical protein
VLRPCTVAQVTSGGSINYMISEVMYVLHTGTHLFIYLPCVYAVPYRLNDLWVIYSLYDSDFTTCLRITNRSTLVCTVTPALPGYQHFDILTCSLLHIQPHIVSQMFGVLILTRVKILKTQHRPTHGYTYCTTVDMCTPLQYRRLHVRTASRQPPVPRYIINYR